MKAAQGSEGVRIPGTIMGVKIKYLIAVAVAIAIVAGYFVVSGGGHALTVKVIDSSTGASISGATVIVGDRIATTGADGLVTFRVPNGTYSIGVQKSGYQSKSYSAIIADNDFYVTLDLVGYGLTVTVVDSATENAIAGARVQVGGRTGTTDDNGTVIFYMPSGTYTITVENSGYQTKSDSVTIGENETLKTIRLVAAT